MIQYFNDAFVVNGDGKEYTVYIYSYEMTAPVVDITNMYDNNFIPTREIIIYGHIDGRDIDDSSSDGPNRFRRKKPEPINNRWEILDL